MAIIITTIHEVTPEDSRAIRQMLKGEGLRARVRLGSNRFYILVRAGGNDANKRAADIITRSGRYRLAPAWEEAYTRDLLHDKIMIERVKE